MTDYRLLGVCGLYCGACYHYRASFPESKHLLEEAKQQGRELIGYTCRGCRSDVLYVHRGCSQCKIRECAESKGVLHCGFCAEYPCKRLRDFQNDGRKHHSDIMVNLKAVRMKGPQQRLEEQARRWTCQCGKKFSWYERVCRHCGTELDSYA